MALSDRQLRAIRHQRAQRELDRTEGDEQRRLALAFGGFTAEEIAAWRDSLVRTKLGSAGVFCRDCWPHAGAGAVNFDADPQQTCAHCGFRVGAAVTPEPER